jgi:hypothetical protein
MKKLVAWLLLGAMLLTPALAFATGLTVVVDSKQAMGGLAVNFLTITWDNSYPTGGEAITAAQCGVSVIHELIVLCDNAGWDFQFDKSALKIMAFGAPTGDWELASLYGDTVALWDEADNAANLSTVDTRAIVFGKP